jgi:hypothetical protein
MGNFSFAWGETQKYTECSGAALLIFGHMLRRMMQSIGRNG